MYERFSQRAHQKNNKSDPLISRLAGQTSYEKRKVHQSLSSSSCRLRLNGYTLCVRFPYRVCIHSQGCLSLCLCGAMVTIPMWGPSGRVTTSCSIHPDTQLTGLLINPPVPLLISNRPPALSHALHIGLFSEKLKSQN